MSEGKRGPGRPKLPPEDKRTVRVALKVSPREKVKLTARASMVNMNLVKSIRTAALEACDKEG